jgi:hypothetical protein
MVIQPVWTHVDLRIDRSFKWGGTVRLYTGEVDLERMDSFRPFECISMTSLPGKFRLIVTPKETENLRESDLREWWEPKDRPFRGTERFGDDEWDTRTVCTDLLVAKQLFKDFFDQCGITEAILDQTLSVWDRKPR